MAVAERVPISLRRVGGQTVESLGHLTPMHELDRLREFVAALAREARRPLRIVEVGSWVGESALAMAQGLLHGGEVWCVDDWGGNQWDQLADVAQHLTPAEVRATFDRNCGALLHDVIHPLPGRSVEVAAALPYQRADLVFLDAEHTYEAVAADIAAWRKHLAPGGVLCGHDYCHVFPGLVQAVHEAFGEPVQALRGTSIWVAYPDK